MTVANLSPQEVRQELALRTNLYGAMHPHASMRPTAKATIPGSSVLRRESERSAHKSHLSQIYTSPCHQTSEVCDTQVLATPVGKYTSPMDATLDIPNPPNTW